MDKTLEIIMVAVALVVAVVIVTALLQGQADSFGGFATSQTDSSGCTIDSSKLSPYCGGYGSSDTSCSNWDSSAAEEICDTTSCGNDLAPADVC